MSQTTSSELTSTTTTTAADSTSPTIYQTTTAQQQQPILISTSGNGQNTMMMMMMNPSSKTVVSSSSNEMSRPPPSPSSHLSSAAFKQTTNSQQPATNIIVVTAPTSASIDTTNSNAAVIVQPNTNSTTSNTNNSSSTYGGFAYCSNCGEYGVKAAFYGKSKLYCSVACQNDVNGNKKQQQQQQQQKQGTKRTIDQISYSPVSASTPILTNASGTNILAFGPQLVTTTTTTTPNPSQVQSNPETTSTPTSVTPTLQSQVSQTTTTTPTTRTPAATISAYLSAAAQKSAADQHANSMNNSTSSVDSGPVAKRARKASSSSSSSLSSSAGAVEFASSAPSSLPPSVALSLSLNASVTRPTTIVNNLATFQPQTTTTPATGQTTTTSVIKTAQPTPTNQISESNTVSQPSNTTIKSIIAPTVTVAAPTATTPLITTATAAATTTPKPEPSPPQQTTTQSNDTVDSTTPTPTTTAFEWSKYIESSSSRAAPVHLFKHVPMVQVLSHLRKDTLVECVNNDRPPLEQLSVTTGSTETIYWFARIVDLAGYYAKLRYVGYDEFIESGVERKSADFWVHMGDQEHVHEVGWCARNGRLLCPPSRIARKCDDWEQFIMKHASGCRTLNPDFHQKIRECNTGRFKKGMFLEVIDKRKPSQMRLAKIVENKGGRLNLKYENSQEPDYFWCHAKSDVVHPVGWSVVAGHDIDATEEYKQKSKSKYLNSTYEPTDCVPSMFTQTETTEKSHGLKVGMKLEAVDPQFLSTIRVASVEKLLKDYYLMIKFDGFNDKDNLDTFCYRRTSAAIMPAGFCNGHSIELKGPYTQRGKFNWSSYLKKTDAEFVPSFLLYDNICERMNKFEEGMKLESVDLMDPKTICAATVAKVAGRLILIRFDGWPSEFDQWVDCESCDIFPVGWCKLFEHNFDPPPITHIEETLKVGKKKRPKRKLKSK